MGKTNRVNYHGYLGLSRHNKLVIHDLGHLYFGVYMGLIQEAIWDRTKEDFGYVVATNKELEKLFGTDESTISRHIKALCRKGYVIKTKGKVKIVDFSLFEISIVKKLAKMDFASVHELRAYMQGLNAKTQEESATLQDSQLQNSSQSFNVSSKVGLGLSHSEEDIDLDEIDQGIEQMRKERGEVS